MGRGAVGIVYQAEDTLSGSTVAIKRPHRPHRWTQHALRHEFQQRREIAHPNLVGVRGLLEDELGPCLVLEWVEGRPITEWLRDIPLDRRAVALRPVLAEVVAGLRVLHRHGRTHGDLKPSHVLVSEARRPVLIDFDLMRSTEPVGHGHEGPGQQGGSPGYIAPEILLGRPPTPATDLFGLGALVWELCFGTPPFGESPQVTASLDRRPTPPKETPPIDPELALLAERLMDPEPTRRPRLEAVATALGARGPVDGGRRVLVGRETELSALEREDAAPGFRLAVVRGPSGIGKTTLIRTHLSRAHLDRPGSTWHATCSPDADVPFRGIDGWIDELAMHAPGLVDEGFDLDPLCHLFPRLADAEARRAPGPDVELNAAKVFCEAVRHVARARPLRLWLDDAQWLDADAGPFVEQILQRHPAGVTLYVCVRGRMPAWLEGADLQVALSGLDDPALQGWCEARSMSLSPSRREAWLAATAGNPYMLASLFDATDPEVRVDPRQLLLRRYGRLSPSAQDLLIASCLSLQPVPLDLMHRLSRGDSDRALSDLRHGRFLATQEVMDRPCVSSPHALLTEVLERHVEMSRLREVHHRLASEWAREPEPNPWLVAHHLHASGRLDATLPWARRAAEAAMATHAWHVAARWFRVLVDADPHDHDAALHLARALTAAGRVDDAIASWDVLREVHPNSAARQEAALTAAELAWGAGDVVAGEARLRPLLADAGIDWPARARPIRLTHLLWWRARLWLWHLRGRPTRPLGEQERRRLDVSWVAAGALSAVDTVTGLQFHARHIVDALRASDAGLHRHRALIIELAFRASDAMDDRTSRWVHHEVRRLKDEASSAMERALSSWGLGYAAFITGRISEAISELEEASDAWRQESRGGWGRDHADRHLAWSYRFAARFEDMRRISADLSDRARRTGNRMLRDQLEVGPLGFCDLIDHDPRRFARRLAAWGPLEDLPIVLAFAVGRGRVDLALYEGDANEAMRLVHDLDRAMHEVRTTLHRRLEHPLHVASAMAFERDGSARRASTRRLLATMPTDETPWVRATRTSLEAWLHWEQDEVALAEATWRSAASLWETLGMHGRALASRWHADIAVDLDSPVPDTLRARGVTAPHAWIRTELVGPAMFHQEETPHAP